MGTLTISLYHSDNEDRKDRPDPLQKEIEASKRLGEYLREKRKTVPELKVAVYPLPESPHTKQASVRCEIALWEEILGRLSPYRYDSKRRYLIWLRNKAPRLGYIPVEWKAEAIEEIWKI